MSILRFLALGDKKLSPFNITHRFTHLFWLGDLNYRVDLPTWVRGCPPRTRAPRDRGSLKFARDMGTRGPKLSRAEATVPPLGPDAALLSNPCL